MPNLLSHCFYYATPFQMLERFRVFVPWNVPPFHMERDAKHVGCKSLIQINIVWNVPRSKSGTGAIRSTPHSPLGSVWKLSRQVKSSVYPLVNRRPLRRRNASLILVLGWGWTNLKRPKDQINADKHGYESKDNRPLCIFICSFGVLIFINDHALSHCCVLSSMSYQPISCVFVQIIGSCQSIAKFSEIIIQFVASSRIPYLIFFITPRQTVDRSQFKFQIFLCSGHAILQYLRENSNLGSSDNPMHVGGSHPKHRLVKNFLRGES